MPVQFESTTDPKKIAANQRALIQQKGDILNQEQVDQMNQYGQLAGQYQSWLDPYLLSMAEGQGGYTPEEQAQINQDEALNNISNFDYAGNYLTPEEEQNIRGNTASYGAQFNPDQMSQDQTVSAGQQRAAVQGLQSGLRGSINNDALGQSDAYRAGTQNQLALNKGEFGTTLGAVGQNVRGAMDPTALRGAIDPNVVMASDKFLQDYQMTPEEQQNIVTGAGISAGVQNQAAVGALERQARAAGASPEGVAAYRARMNQQSAGEAGDAMTQARIAASNAAAQRQLQGEQLREQGGQYLTGQRTGAEEFLTGLGTTAEQQLGAEALQGQQNLGQQALSQANTAEAQRLAAEQGKTALNLQAATTGGLANLANEQAINAQGRNVGQFNAVTGAQIAQAQDQANSQRAAQMAANRQNVNLTNQGNQFNRGAQIAQTRSANAQNIANQRINQRNNALSGFQTAQAQNNQNVQNAANRQTSIYGTQAGGTNQAANTSVQASQIPGTLAKIGGFVTGLVGAAGGGSGIRQGVSGQGADGKIVTKPTVMVLGEDGPEAVVPMGYRARAQVRPSVAMGKEAIRKRRPYGEVA